MDTSNKHSQCNALAFSPSDPHRQSSRNLCHIVFGPTNLKSSRPKKVTSSSVKSGVRGAGRERRSHAVEREASLSLLRARTHPRSPRPAPCPAHRLAPCPAPTTSFQVRRWRPAPCPPKSPSMSSTRRLLHVQHPPPSSTSGARRPIPSLTPVPRSMSDARLPMPGSRRPSIRAGYASVDLRPPPRPALGSSADDEGRRGHVRPGKKIRRRGRR